MSAVETQKREAALAALALVESGMTLGLGSGSTARHLTLELGRRLATGELARVRGVPTSEATARLAREAGVPLIELPAGGLDLAIDGMDEVTPGLDAIKGLGGALLREKIVAASAARFVLIGDASKRVSRLGERAPVPVEVLGFGLARTRARLEALGGRVAPRLAPDGADYATDNGNPVLDLHLDAPFDPRRLAADLAEIPGAVGHGLFLGLARLAFLATADGVETIGERDGAGA